MVLGNKYLIILLATSTIAALKSFPNRCSENTISCCADFFHHNVTRYSRESRKAGGHEGGRTKKVDCFNLDRIFATLISFRHYLPVAIFGPLGSVCSFSVCFYAPLWCYGEAVLHGN